MSNGLYDPLGDGRASLPRRRPSPLVVTACIVSASILIFGAVVALRSGHERGEPGAVVTIERAPSVPPLAAMPLPSSPQIPQPGPAAPAAVATTLAGPASDRAASVEIQNGVRIVRMRPDPLASSSQSPTGSPGVTTVPKGLSSPAPAGTLERYAGRRRIALATPSMEKNLLDRSRRRP